MDHRTDLVRMFISRLYETHDINENSAIDVKKLQLKVCIERIVCLVVDEP